MRKNELLIILVALGAYVIGFLVSWWPLSLLGVFVLAVCGRWFIALLCALVLDLLFGAPTGIAHMIQLPYTLSVLVIVFVRAVLIRHLR